MIVFLKMFLCRITMHLWQPFWKSFAWNVKLNIIFSSVWLSENVPLYKKNAPLTTLLKIFCLKCENKTTFFMCLNIWKCSSVHVKSDFDNHAQCFLLKVRIISAQKWTEFLLFLKYLFFSKSSSVHVECNLDNPAQSFLFKKFFWKYLYFYIITVFLERFLWPSRMQLWQTCQKIPAQILVNFLSNPCKKERFKYSFSARKVPVQRRFFRT